MPYDAKAVANYFLELAQRDGIPVTPMKLQKLVYFAHGWSLALTGQPLVNDRVEAWEFGPVFRRLYGEFKAFGNAPITSKATDFRQGGRVWWGTRTVVPTIEDENTKHLLDRIWEVYGRLSATRLSNMTHEPDGPWAQALSRQPDARGVVIDNGAIRDYFAAQERQ
jgi:uncharacterized phage-associated protein